MEFEHTKELENHEIYEISKDFCFCIPSEWLLKSIAPNSGEISHQMSFWSIGFRRADSIYEGQITDSETEYKTA